MTESVADDGQSGPARPRREFDATVPSPARMWNYWVGGKDHFAADRAAAEGIAEALPSLPVVARSVRAFLKDITAELVTEHGIRQFLDLGTGLPTADNTHEVAQRAAPECRVVYSDYDPSVLAHARALLTSTPEGKTDYVQGDLRDTETILKAAAATLDFSQPVAVMLFAVLHFIADSDEPYRVVAALMDAVPGGQLPGDRARAERPVPRGVDQRAQPALQRLGRGADEAAQPGGGQPVLRRPGTAAPGRGDAGAVAVAAAGRPGRRPGLGRRRPQALAGP